VEEFSSSKLRLLKPRCASQVQSGEADHAISIGGELFLCLVGDLGSLRPTS
jgi:hypothetical protein